MIACLAPAPASRVRPRRALDPKVSHRHPSSIEAAGPGSCAVLHQGRVARHGTARRGRAREGPPRRQHPGVPQGTRRRRPPRRHPPRHPMRLHGRVSGIRSHHGAGVQESLQLLVPRDAPSAERSAKAAVSACTHAAVSACSRVRNRFSAKPVSAREFAHPVRQERGARLVVDEIALGDHAIRLLRDTVRRTHVDVCHLEAVLVQMVGHRVVAA